MISETWSCIFRWCSRCPCCRGCWNFSSLRCCLNSLMLKLNMECWTSRYRSEYRVRLHLYSVHFSTLKVSLNSPKSLLSSVLCSGSLALSSSLLQTPTRSWWINEGQMRTKSSWLNPTFSFTLWTCINLCSSRHWRTKHKDNLVINFISHWSIGVFRWKYVNTVATFDWLRVVGCA